MPLIDDGQTIEPFVSVPTASGARCAAMATADPELEPHAVRRGSRGFTASPPTALQPLDEPRERKFAHSDRFAFAMMMAPASVSLSTSGALLARRFCESASDPAVVTQPAAQTSAEGAVVSTGDRPAAGIAFEQRNIERLLTREPMAPAAAACLGLAWKHRRVLLAA